MQSHVEDVLFQIRRTYIVFVATVVTGRVAPLEANDAPHAMARAVPSSFMRIINWSPSTGVPVRLVVMLVIAAACAVIVNMSTLSVFIAGVAEDTVVPVRAVMRLLVNVAVPLTVSTFAPPT
jgi:hypothetical protein